MKFEDGKKDVYEEVFNSFDVDHNGYLSVRELGKCMKALGDKYTAKDIKFLIQCADKDENGKMDCDEFCMTASIMNLVSMDNLKQLREVFISFDLDGNGTINCRELSRCMEKLGQPLSKAECKELIASADKDEDNCMSFYEFVIMVKSEKKDLGEDDQSLREAFNLFDKNGDGSIDKEELRKVLETMEGENPTEDELDELFREADLNNNGRISFEEFQSIVN